MDASLYMVAVVSGIFIVLLIILVLGILSGQMATFHRLSEQSRKESRKQSREADEKQSSFLRHMHIESKKDSRQTERLLERIEQGNAELRQMNKDNAIYLRMIFERVDKPEEFEA
ncbi:MAG: hypothetical protein ABUK01_00265 [Leptospirales bacterium]